MSAEEESSGGNGRSLFQMSTLVLLLSILGGSFLLEAPFETLRSPSSENRGFLEDSLEDVEARLWQDPLAVALNEFRKPDESKGMDEHDVIYLARDINRFLTEQENELGGKPLMILPVMTPGSPYAEDREQRRRMRHSVISGLAAEGYISEQPEHIGYFSFSFPEAWSRFKPVRFPVAFEWYKRQTGQSQEIRYLRGERNRAKRQAKDLLEKIKETQDKDQKNLLQDQRREKLNQLRSVSNEIDTIEKQQEIDRQFNKFFGDAEVEPPKRVLILWLNETFFQHKYRLDYLLKTLIGFRFLNYVKADTETPRASFAVIGPASSQTLKSFGENKEHLPPPKYPRKFFNLENRVKEMSSDLIASFNKDPLIKPSKSVVELDDTIQATMAEWLNNQDHSYTFSDLEEKLNEALKPHFDNGFDNRYVRARSKAIASFTKSHQRILTGAVRADRTRLDPYPVFYSYPTASSSEIGLLENLSQRVNSLASALYYALPETIPDIQWSDEVTNDPFYKRIQAEIEAWVLSDHSQSQEELAEKLTTILLDQSDELVAKETVRKFIDQYAGVLSSTLPFSHYHRVNTQDDQLAATLAMEMFRRRDPFIELKESVMETFGELNEKLYDPDDFTSTLRGKVVLIGERDTMYARSLLADVKRLLSEPPLWVPESDIIVKGYLRGLDGVIAGHSGKAREKGPDDGEISSQNRSDLEQPVGKSQLDYIRRLASQLALEDRRSPKKIRAIGILGVDLYDKQLILQALRPHFPKAYFFTTDLDARLLHPGQYKWARNLIIASGFDLSLQKDFQGLTPPFRDSYQTAMFLATRLALHDKPDKLHFEPEPLVFEVARRGAYQLSGSYAEHHPQIPKLENDYFLTRDILLFLPFLALLIWQRGGIMRSATGSLSGRFKRFREKWIDPWRGHGWEAFFSHFRHAFKRAFISSTPPVRNLPVQKRDGWLKRFFKGWFCPQVFRPFLLFLRLSLWASFWAFICVVIIFLPNELTELDPHSIPLNIALALICLAYIAKCFVLPAKAESRLRGLIGQCLLVIGLFVFLFFIIGIFADESDALILWVMLATLAFCVWLTPTLQRLFKGLLPLLRTGVWLTVMIWSLDPDSLLPTIQFWTFLVVFALYTFNRTQIHKKIGPSIHILDFGIPLTWLLVRVAMLDTMEPFAWFEGISIWPTILLSWFIILLGIWFALRGRAEIDGNDIDIDVTFFPPENITDSTPSPEQPIQDPDSIPAGYIWSEYREERMQGRAFGWTLFLISGVFICNIFINAPKPGRGITSNLIEGLLFPLTGMVMFAMEHTRACVSFIRQIALDPRVVWSKSARDATRRELRAETGMEIPGYLLDDYLDIKMVIRRTTSISNLIIYPFLIIFLNLVAHGTWFDNWSHPMFLYLFFGFLASYSLGCAVWLRRVSEQARQATLDQIQKRMLHQDNLHYREGLNEIMRRIEAIREGALAPWSRHPILQAVLWPLGGLSTIAASEYFLLLLR